MFYIGLSKFHKSTETTVLKLTPLQVNKGWQRRWFMLKGNMLFYYHNPHDTEPIGLIVLEGCSINSCSTDNTTFSITFQCGGSRTYNLCADDEESCTAWVNSLQRSSYSYLRAQVDRMHEQVSDFYVAGQALILRINYH